MRASFCVFTIYFGAFPGSPGRVLLAFGLSSLAMCHPELVEGSIASLATKVRRPLTQKGGLSPAQIMLLLKITLR
jgi:hypothetical protein